MILGGVSLLLGALFTVGLLLYFCCRCCCCGGRKKDKPRVDAKFDNCKRPLLTGLMSLLILAMIFAVACAFLSNQYVHSSAAGLPDYAKRLLDDVRSYRELNNRRLRKLLITDFSALNSTMVEGVAAASGALVAGLKASSGATALDRLFRLSQSAGEVLGRLEKVERSLTVVEGSGVELRRQLLRLEKSLETDLTNCLSRASEESELCRTAQTIFDTTRKLELERLSDTSALSGLRTNLAQIKAYNIPGELAEAEAAFADLEAGFRREISEREIQLKEHLRRYSANLSSYADQATTQLARLRLSDAYTAVEQNQGRYQKVEFYRWIAGMVLLSLVAFSVLAFGLGLFYGCCGKRPSYYEDDCCVRVTGSRLFCCGITTSLLFLFVFLVTTVAVMFLGATSENWICDPLRHPEKRQDVVGFVEKYAERLRKRSIASDPFLQDLTVQALISGCTANESLYRILGVEKKLGLEGVMSGEAAEYKELVTALRSLTAEFRVPDSVPSLLSSESESRLAQLRELDLEGGLPRELLAGIDSQLAAFGIVSQVEAMKARVASLPAGEGREMVVRLLQDLGGIAEETARPLQTQLEQLRGNLTLLNDSIPNLSRNVPAWLADLRAAEVELRSNVAGLVAQVGEEVAQRLASYVHTYRAHLKESLERDVGSCAPLRSIASSSVSVLCDHTLNPFNTLWASTGLCLLLLLPTILLAVSLRDLYSNTEPFTGSN